MANPMRALPSPSGASLGSEGPPKGQKCAFGTRNHIFWEISRNYEIPNSKNFGLESGARLSWVRWTDSRAFGRLAVAAAQNPVPGLHGKLACTGLAEAGNVFWRLRILDGGDAGCASRDASGRRWCPETSCVWLGHYLGVRRNSIILPTLPVRK